jgi:hypothetical protein
MIGDWHYGTPVTAFRCVTMGAWQRPRILSWRSQRPVLAWATLKRAAKFVGAIRPWRQAYPHWGLCRRAATEGRADQEKV